MSFVHVFSARVMGKDSGRDWRQAVAIWGFVLPQQLQTSEHGTHDIPSLLSIKITLSTDKPGN